MAKKIGEWNGHNIFEYTYNEWRNQYKCNGLECAGVLYRFYEWLVNNDLVDEYTTIDDMNGLVNGARDGNRFDLNDDIRLRDMDDIVISFLYVVNGCLWATLYDRANNNWYGDIEISC